MEIVPGLPAVINDTELSKLSTAVAIDLFGADALFSAERTAGCDDFAYYAEKAPSLYAWVGAKLSLIHIFGQRIVDAIKWYEDYIISIGVDIKGTNPAPDNIKGGLSTIEEKALGAVEKGGTRPIQDLITYNGTVAHRGLTLLDASPGGVENTTSLTSIGCQIIIFSTGKGNPIGNPITPTIKVTGNARTVDNYGDNIDVDISAVMTEGMDLGKAGELLYELSLIHI